MSANTAFLNLYKPGGGSSGLIVPDEVVDIDRINGNMDLIDSFASGWGPSSQQTRDFTGPAASLTSIVAARGGPRLGDTYQETDADKRLWRYDGSNWLSNESGLYLIRPTSANLVGATIDATGKIIPTGSVSSFSANGVFSSRFTAYLIEMFINFGSGAAPGMRLRVAGTDLATNTYLDSKLFTTNGAAPAVTEANSTGYEFASNTALSHWIKADLVNPAGSTTNQSKLITGVSRGVGGNTHSTMFGGNPTANDTTAYDGFTIYAYVSVQNFTTLSWVKIYGMA